MFNSTVLEVAIGLCFCFAAISLIASSVNEALASLLGLRAASLLRGIKELVNDPRFTGLAKQLYNHSLINPLLDGSVEKKEDQLAFKPSYIDARRFADAFIECLPNAPRTFGDLGGAIEKVDDRQLKVMLQGMYTRAGGQLDALRSELARWFDAGMNHVSGAYKRRAQLTSFCIAFALAGLLNVDTFRLFRVLWLHPDAVAKLATTRSAPEALTQLATLPSGWGEGAASLLSWHGPVVIGGWLITASAALFGAPFWFDVLQRFVNLRGTGQKPASGEKNEAST